MVDYFLQMYRYFLFDPGIYLAPYYYICDQGSFKRSFMTSAEDQSLDKLIVVGDRVLIKPVGITDQTKGGLYLPQGYKEKEEIQTGYVIRVGPGYPVPAVNEEIEEPWKKMEEKIKYIPLQAKVGDKAIFLQKGAIEIVYNEEKYYIVAQYSILLLERDEELF
jgi:co-chaperonin GroES (HSP10)